MKKKITILIAALAISVGLNLYYYGWKAWEAKERRDRQLGANIVISQIINKIQQNKEVAIPTGNGPLILVPKTDESNQGTK